MDIDRVARELAEKFGSPTRVARELGITPRQWQHIRKVGRMTKTLQRLALALLRNTTGKTT